ncbi:AzlC family ABC transporter permease [Nocardioides dubius]|uniref:AzlC family ABC transporter permease n=1 Tax=Nocardioides dubius TaxID=317019 RepID=A0ABP4EF13_9ACTN
MRRLLDLLGPATLRDLLLVNVAVGLVGVSYGAITVGAGFEIWVPTLMSIVVFGGASQFLFTGLIAAGASPIAAVAAGALVNARHLPFGFALADTVSKRPWLGGYLMIDEVVAFALAQRDPARRRLVFFTCGAMLWTFWNVGALLGGLLGQAIPDTDAWGLDAAFPAVLLALVMPAMRQARIRNASLLGAVIALALTPFVPAGLAVLCALAALLVVRPHRAADAGTDAGTGGTA